MDMLQLVVEPRRREILRLLWDQELSVGEVASQFPVSLAAVSLHLGVLREAGLVTVRPDGKRRLYRANRDALARLAPMLETMWRQDLDRLAAVAEGDEPTGGAGQR
jgi:DNA-binding transcriptional ArsR family regulator